MADMHWLNFEHNLQKQAALGVSAWIWETPIMRKAAEEYSVATMRSESNIFTGELEWRKVVDKAVALVDVLNLPAKMSIEVKQVIVFTGEKIFLWFVHCVSELSLSHKFAQNIYWTHYGIIDEKRIFDDWKNDPTFPSLRDPYESKVVLYALASVHADVDFLERNLPDVADTIRKYIGLKIPDFSKFKVNSAMAALLIWYIVDSEEKTNNSRRFASYYSKLKDSKYKAGTDVLFTYCVKAKLDKAAEFFYPKLKESDRKGVLFMAGVECLNNSNKEINHATERTAEILLYLLNKMPFGDKRIFLAYRIVDIYTIFLNTWPYQQLCPSILDCVWEFLPTELCFQILQNTVRVVKCFSKTRNKMYQIVLLPILRNVMGRSFDFEEKEKVFCQKSLVYELFQIPDFDIINVIVNDVDLKDKRFDMMDISSELDDYLKNGGSFDNIKEYMEKVTFTDEEKKTFSKFLYDTEFLGDLLHRGRVNTVVEIVKWQSDYDEEKIIKRKEKLKKEFDSYDICYGLLFKGRYNDVDEYLNWIYDGKIDDEEFKEVRAKLFKPELIREVFCHTWIKKRKLSLSVVKKSCSKLLKYLFKTDDEVLSFKKEQLVDCENFFKVLFTTGSSYLLKLDEIFDFCLIPADKVTELKMKIKSNSDWWFDKYADNPGRFLVLNSLLNWISDSEDEKKDVIKKVMNSPKGTELCFYIYHLDDPEGGISDETKKLFVNEWLKECDLEEMKDRIMKLERNDRVKDKDVQKVLEKMDQSFTEDASSESSDEEGNPSPFRTLGSLLNFALGKAFF